MRRTSVTGLALALLLALVAAPTAVASPLLTLRDDGSTFVREDRFLTPAGELPEAARAPASAPTERDSEEETFARAASKRRKTVRGELRRMLRAGAITRATHDAKREIYDDARRLRRKLKGARRDALSAVLSNIERVAASGRLTVGRLPAQFETVRRNRAWWSDGPLLSNGRRVSFAGSKLVWQYYAGEGLQIQWLGTFGKANGLWQGKYDTSLRKLLDEALTLSSQRAGGIAWEYMFDFDGGRPPWVSGLAQGTAMQALARGSVRLGEPRYMQAARSAMGIFRAKPPEGVRVGTDAGAHYLIYSFARRLRVLNAFTQSLNGLFDYAKLSGDAEAAGLFSAGEAQLRDELSRYDTGAWSRYSTRREADLGYHKLARDFLRNLCGRMREAAALTATPGGGAAVLPGAAPANGAPDPEPYCAAAKRWTDYLSQPPKIELVSRRARGGKPASLRFKLSKPANVTLRLRRGGKTRVVLHDRFASGRRSLRWRRPPRTAGGYDVVLSATDLAGNRGGAKDELRVLKARRR